MNKIFTLLISIILAGLTLTSYSQDTTHSGKKPEGVLVPSVYKPIIRPGKKTIIYKKPDSLAKAKVLTVIKPKPDTVKKPAAAQLPAPTFVDNTINGQYNTLVKKLYPFQRTMLDGFYKNVADTLNSQRKVLSDSTAKITELNKTIKDLQGAVNVKDQALSSGESKGDEMSFVGLPVSKLVFTYIMWGIVLVLGTSLGTVIYLSGANRHEATHRRQEYDDLILEFQTYKAKATEREKKLGRELQTERNKVDELLGLGRKD